MSLDFEIANSDLKHYPHFDALISKQEIIRLVTDPSRVAENTFFPFLMFNKEWQPFRKKPDGKPPKKKRQIRYGARRDAYIFSYYRSILSPLYEKKLLELGIENCPIAYRKIKNKFGSGKCNIDFAKDAFDAVDEIGDCFCICLDISSYFENLDHELIKKLWCELLGVKRLPADHYAVFKNITKYHYVNQCDVYRRLGYIGTIDKDRPKIEGFIKKIPSNKQLCSRKDFREKICGKDSLVEGNPHNYGIPQGAPISDLIANFYLMYFDTKINTYAKEHHGKYFRYSDDILIIIPKNSANPIDIIDLICKEIKNYGSQLNIKKEKTQISQFKKTDGHLECEPIHFDEIRTGNNGLEYLGFRYDGKNVYIRESTVSRFYRKISGGSKAAAYEHVTKNSSMSIPELIDSFNYSLFYQRYGKVANGYYKIDDCNSWTFYSYIKRSAQIFDKKGILIHRQFKNFKLFTRNKIIKSITKFYNSIHHGL